MSNISLKRFELLMIFVILINSHIKDFFLLIHALFLASDFEDFVLNKLYYRLIFLELIHQNKRVIICFQACSKILEP